jgi:succinate-semialdehyde dehydrogenase / glutarate-semialdehyde dehydrogenase
VNYETVNPATGEFVDRFATISDRDLDRVVDMAQAAFIDWRRRNVTERVVFLERPNEAREKQPQPKRPGPSS